MAHPSKLAFVAFWLSNNTALLGLLAVALTVAAAGTFLLIPLGPYKQIVGTVEGFGLAEDRTGSYPVANVRLTDRRVAVVLPRAQSCSVGDAIHLQLHRHLWGTSAVWIACDPMYRNSPPT